MHHYAVFGRCLRSEVEFPDLPKIRPARAEWTLRVVAGPRPPAPGELPLGRHAVGGGELRLSRSDHGLHLSLIPVGECTISDDGTELLWYSHEGAREELMRVVVLGPVLALALQQAEVLCLHGSAVAVNGRALALLAPKFHGKSTLALALVRAGAQLLTDDAIAVDLEPVPSVRPGVLSVRLHEDSVDELVSGAFTGQLLPGYKQTLVGMPQHMLASEELPLDAVYLLAPVRRPPDEPAITRTAVAPSLAAVALAHHTKLVDPLVGMDGAGLQLRWCSAVARRVPVYALEIVRDFDRLDEAVEQLMSWHSGCVAGSVRGES